MLHVLKEKFHVYILCEYQEHSSVQRFTITLFVKATFFSLTTIVFIKLPQYGFRTDNFQKYISRRVTFVLKRKTSNVLLEN